VPDVEPQQISTLVWLFRSGGLVLLVWGIISALLAIVPVVRPNRKASLIVGLLALLPVIAALFSVYFAAAEYASMAAAPVPPKPTEFAQVTGLAMSRSFFGLLGSLLAMSTALVAIVRSTAPKQPVARMDQV
jgi:hypothetical protein